MATPERELPPLRVKILGDNSSFKKAVNEAEALAKGMAEHIKKVTRGPGGVGADREVIRRQKQMNKAYKEQAANDQKQVDAHTKASRKEQETQQKANQQRQVESEKAKQERVKQKEAYLKDINDQADRDQKRVLADRQARIERIKAQDKAYKNEVKQADALVAEQNREQGKQRTERQRRMREQDRMAAREIRQIAARDRAEQAAIRRRIAGERRIQREEERRNRGTAGSGLGNRADLYMHTAGIRNVASLASGFVNAMAEWQQMSVQMEGFTGSAKEASRVMQELQTHAIQSPYGLQEIANSTRLMMAYGQETNTAIEITKRLGDVAGGSNEKLARLSLGMAQITSMGKLQGQELRQLTEHGFNPLMTMAKGTAADPSDPESVKKRYAELDAMKRKGLITSEAVIAALKVETSMGGKFYGMSERMSKTVMGLTQQIKEYIVVAQRIFMESIQADLEKSLRSVVNYLKATIEWMKTNKEAVRGWAILAKNVAVGVVAFHAAGIAIAGLSWIGYSAAKMYGVLTAAIRTATLAMSLFTVAGRASVATSLASISPLAAKAGAIGGVAVAAAGLGYVLYNLNPHIQRYNKEMERATRLSTSVREGHSNRHRTMVEEATKMADPAERKNYLAEQLAAAKTELDGMNNSVQAQAKLVQKLEPAWYTAYQGGRLYWTAAQTELEQSNMLRDEQKSRVTELEQLVKDAANPGPDWAKLLGNKDVEDGMEKMRKVAYQSAPTAAIYKSGEHAQRLFDYSRRMEGVTTLGRGVNSVPDKQDKANKILERIERNTRGAGANVLLSESDLVGVE